MNLTFDSSIRRVSLIWLLSLTAVAALALSSDLLMSSQVTRSLTFSEFVNIVGRQRMWTSQVALHAAQYVNAETAIGRATYARRLRQSLATMRVEYDLLLAETAEVPAVVEVIESGEMALRGLSAAYFDAAASLLTLPDGEVSPQARPYRYIADNADLLLNRFDAATRALIRYNQEQKGWLSDINTLRVVIVLAILAVQFAFVFRPTIARLRSRAAALETEITERKRAEADLRASEARFRTLAETTPVGIFESDLNGALTWVNARWQDLVGLKGTDALGTGWMDALHPDDRAVVLVDAARKVNSGDVATVDYRIRRTDGTELSLHSIAAPTLAPDGTPAGILGTVMDITERKLAEERAIKLEAERQRIKVLSEFIRDTSHDLRTPITVIKSGLYLCRRITDIERIREKAQTIEAHVDYLNVVIDQLQQMAVLDSLTEVTLMPTSLEPLLREAARAAIPDPDAAGLTVRFEVPGDLPNALVAPDRMLEALRAVMDNARRYTASGGNVTVTASAAGDTIEVTVIDTGIGIAPEHARRVFERLYRVDQARGIGGGAGLGLPIAKRVIELHGGTIAIESVPGAGTTVRMTMPAERVTD